MSKGTFVKGFIFAACLVMSILQTDFSLWLLWERGGRFFSMASDMFPPDTQFLTQVLAPLRDTLFISLMGTGLGAFIGFAGTVLCNSYVNRNNALRAGIKTVVHLVRCIPVLILALLCTLFMRLWFSGPFFTICRASKIFFPSEDNSSYATNGIDLSLLK